MTIRLPIGMPVDPPYELPMRMPAAKTIAPPSTIWVVARRNGVCMERFRIQTIVHSSRNTATKAMPVAIQKWSMR